MALVLCSTFLSLQVLFPQTLNPQAYLHTIYCSFYSEVLFLASILTIQLFTLHVSWPTLHNPKCPLLSPPCLRLPVFSLHHASLLSFPQCLAASACLISRYIDKCRYTYTCPSPFPHLGWLLFFFQRSDLPVFFLLLL